MGRYYDTNQIILSLSADYKTTKNIRTKKAFTISFGDAPHVVGCDSMGLVSGSDTSNKVQKAGFTIQKSSFMDAPIICELLMTLKCCLIKVNEDENIIGEGGLTDATRLRPISYDHVHKALLCTP